LALTGEEMREGAILASLYVLLVPTDITLMPPKPSPGAVLEVLVSTNIGRMPKQHAWIEILIGHAVSVEEVDERRVRRWDAPDQRASRTSGTNGTTSNVQ